MTVLEIVERDSYGEFIARPATWPEEHGTPPRVLMVESKQDKGPAAGIGDRVLARITALGPDADPPYQARTIKRLPRLTRSQLGIFRALPGGGGVIDPVDRKQLKEWRVAGAPPTTPRMASSSASSSVDRRASAAPTPVSPTGSAIRMISGRQASSPFMPTAFPTRFPDAVVARGGGGEESLISKRREDLRHLPSRHHRSGRTPATATMRWWAEADPDPSKQRRLGGHGRHRRCRLLREAGQRPRQEKRGSAAIPSISRTASCRCCLSASPTISARCKPTEAGPASPCAWCFDKDGSKRGHHFLRGLMRSAASTRL